MEALSGTQVLNHYTPVYPLAYTQTGCTVTQTEMQQPGDFATGTIDPTSGTITVRIDFEPVTLTYSGMEYTLYTKTYTVTDGNGNTLTGKDRISVTSVPNSSLWSIICSMHPDNVSAGLSFGYYAAGVPSQTLTFDDVCVVGGEANTVKGATIRITDKIEEQDIKFVSSLATSSYYTSAGYSVVGYGAILAIEGYYQQANLNELTVESASGLIADKHAICKKVDLGQGEALPAEVGVTLKGSAGLDNLPIGLKYRLRVFVVYSNGTDTVNVCSANDILNCTENGACIRSVYATAKNIAKAEVKAGTEAVPVTYSFIEGAAAGDVQTALNAILAGGGSSATAITVGETVYTNGDLLLAFTAANSALISG